MHTCVHVCIRMYTYARIFKSEAKCLEIINFTSSCRAKKFILYDVLKDSSNSGGCGIQYLYNIYKRQVCKPFSE